MSAGLIAHHSITSQSRVPRRIWIQHLFKKLISEPTTLKIQACKTRKCIKQKQFLSCKNYPFKASLFVNSWEMASIIHSGHKSSVPFFSQGISHFQAAYSSLHHHVHCGKYLTGKQSKWQRCSTRPPGPAAAIHSMHQCRFWTETTTIWVFFNK